MLYKPQHPMRDRAAPRPNPCSRDSPGHTGSQMVSLASAVRRAHPSGKNRDLQRPFSRPQRLRRPDHKKIHPDKTTASTASTRRSASKASVSRVPGPPPATAAAQTARSCGVITVTPVLTSASCAHPTPQTGHISDQVCLTGTGHLNSCSTSWLIKVDVNVAT